MIHAPIHLPSGQLASALAEHVTQSGDVEGFLADLAESEGRKDRTVEVENIAVERFGVHGVMSDDPYIAAVLAHAAELLA